MAKVSTKTILWSVVTLLVLSISIFLAWNWDKFYRIKKIELTEVNCADKASLLQEVFDNDQRVRRQGVPFKEFVETDHKNVETVISILEYCGMPTREEVSKQQLGAIWLVLQHTPYSEYRKQYLGLIEKAVDRGDFSKEQYALMQDRILMEEGEPQLYGTQIVNGKVYKLAEPEYVDQRRAEMGMDPIQKYLSGFGITFDVEQKRK